MNNICKICNQEYPDDKSFHAHFKSHKLSLTKYYQQYYPRFDLYDNSLIVFKNKNYYFNSDFNSKDNLNLWLKSNENDKVKDYIKNWLIKRKERKNLINTMCQVELRSLPIPGINYINKLFGNYYKLCEELGFINRFEDFKQWDNQIKLDGRRKIYCDTREQWLLKFNRISPVRSCLSYGDYAFSNDEWSGKVVFERKSLNDMLGTMSQGFERFKREIKRAVDDNGYIIVIVEELLSNVLNYKELGLVNHNCNISIEYIFHRIRELIQEFNNIQFLFVEGHKGAAEMIEKLFSYGADIKKYDLQLLKDRGII